MIQEVLTNPSELIRRRVDRRGMSLEVVALIVLGLLGGSGMAYVGMQALGAVSGDTPQLRFEFIGEALAPLITLMLVWVWYTVVAHVVSSQFRGRGPISRLFRTSAWAVMPIAVWYLIRSILTVVLFLGVDFPANPDGFTASAQIENILALGLDNPIYYAVLFAGVLFAAWSWRLLTVAVEVSKDLSTEGAQKVAAVPVGTYALYILWTSLQAVGVL